MNSANPESTAEGIVRLLAAGVVLVGALTLWGLYKNPEPSNWLANIGLSIGDNSFRTLSLFGAGALVIGVPLYLRKGLWLVIAIMLITAAVAGYKLGWYSLNNQTSAEVQQASMGGGSSADSDSAYHYVTFKGQQYRMINTKVKMTDAHLKWCDLDDNQNGKRDKGDTDGILNRNNSPLAVANCTTRYINKKAY